MKLAGAFLALIPLAFGGMDKVWEVPIGGELKEPAGWSGDPHHPIVALAFSPDGKRLAVEIRHFRNKVASTHLAIVDVVSPNNSFRQFDLGPGSGPLAWSPDGVSILSGRTVLRLADGGSCEAFPWPPQFVKYAMISRAFWVDSFYVIRNDGAILDLECKETGHWMVDGKWSIAGTEPTKAWVWLRRAVGLEAYEYAVANYGARALLDGVTPQIAYRARGPIFVNAGAAWCFYPYDLKASRCSNLYGAQGLALNERVAVYELIQAATSSSRVLAGRWGHAFSDYFIPDDYSWSMRHRMVWDTRSGRIIASWKTGHFSNCAALSPDGQFVAEGGDGVVRLFRLTP